MILLLPDVVSVLWHQPDPEKAPAWMVGVRGGNDSLMRDVIVPNNPMHWRSGRQLALDAVQALCELVAGRAR